ncbi:hypothetical protein [Streptomyces sp. NPDC002526]
MTGNGSGVHPHEEPEVGRKLRDHPTVNMVFAHSQSVSLWTGGEPQHVREYAEHRRGPLSSNVPEAGGFAPVIAIAERAADLIRGRAPMRSTDSAEDVDLRPARSS